MWDEEFRRSDFCIGYYDGIGDRLIHVPLRWISFKHNDHFSFDLIDHDGVLHSTPLQRIKEVYRDGELIWYRAH